MNLLITLCLLLFYPVILVTLTTFTRNLWSVFRHIFPDSLVHEHTLGHSTPITSYIGAPPPPPPPEHTLQNIGNKECDNDIKLTEDYATEGNNETRDDYVNDDSNDLLSYCFGEDCNNFQIDRNWITVRRKKDDKGIMLHKSFLPLNYQCIENDDIHNDVGEAVVRDNECNVSYHPPTLKAKLQSNVFTITFPENHIDFFSNKKPFLGTPSTVA